MPNKLSIEYIRTLAKERGLKFISQEYTSIYEHHTWECPDKHQWEANVKNVIRNGSGCPYCRVSLSEEKCRFIFEQLTGLPFKRTRKALSKCLELDGYSQELNLAFECNGEQHYQQMWYQSQEKFDSLLLRDKNKVDLCRQSDISLIVIPYTEKDCLEEFIRQELDNLGFKATNPVNWDIFDPHPRKMRQIIEILSKKNIKCLTPRYEGGGVKLELLCNICKHTWQAIPNDLIHSDTGCPKCNKTLLLSLEEVKTFCESKGIKFLSNKYEGRRRKYPFRCKKGHIWETTLMSIKENAGCHVCSGYRKNYSTQWVKDKAVKLGYKFRSLQYQGQDPSYKFQCINCKRIRVCQYRQLRKGPKCPSCHH